MVSFDTVSEVIIHADDLDGLVAFYRDVLGLEIVQGSPDTGFIRFDTAGSDLCLHAGGGGADHRGDTSFTIAVDDIEAARGHLIDHGVEAGEIRREVSGIAVCNATDPEGNPFAIEASVE